MSTIDVFFVINLYGFIFSKVADQQKELQAKAIEEETKKRIEELVAKRVEEELERRKDEIETEVDVIH